MTTYRVAEGAPAVSLNKKVYLPGELLPEDLSDEAAEQLLKTGAIEKAPAKAKSEAEQKAAGDGPVHEGEGSKLPEKDADDPNKRDDKTTTGGVPITEKPATRATGQKPPTLPAK